jgi:tRNA-2-methylthio-N6-dimethylallyladenosine synthase
MKFYVRTYGCQMNVADSDEMSRHLKDRGLIQTDDPDDASVLLVNTCTVRQHAEDRAFSEIGRLKKWKTRQPGRKLVITGCAAERTKDYLENRFPHVDLVIGAKSIEDFGAVVDGLLERRATDEDLEYAVPASNEKISSFVTIMRGCNYSCTYCIVPYVRGRETYHPMEQILSEVRDRVAEGAREITLLGQTVNSYHRNGSRGRATDFADLLEGVAQVPGVKRIRFMSPHPYYMTDRVIQAMASLPEVCESIHLPVQSGSNPILKKMSRTYTREDYLELVGRLRNAMPGMTISTDLIVGFPGETDDDFLQTLSLVEEAGFDWAYIFKYSTREGTPAAAWESFSQAFIEDRHRECLAVVDRVAREKREPLLGSIQEVLIEEPGIGRTRTNYKVQIADPSAAGDILTVRITSIDRATMEGKVI